MTLRKSPSLSSVLAVAGAFTLVPSLHAQTTLAAGDVSIIGYNASGSPDTIALLFLKELTAGTQFFVCDNEVATDGGATFVDTNEAEATFTVQSGQTVAAGTVVILPWGTQTVTNSVYTWTGNTGAGIGASGTGNTLLDDGLYVYTGTTANAVPTAFIYYVKGSASSAANSGNRPAGLVAGETFISPTSNTTRYKTAGATYSGTPSALLTAVGNIASNWEAGAPGAAGDWTFTVGGGGPVYVLTLSVSPASFSESAVNPAATGTVTRSVTDANSLEVTLSSPDPTEVTVPATVTIPANQASVNFDVTAVNDSLPDGNQVVTLTASAPSSTAGNFNVTVQDDADTLPPTALQTGDIAFTTYNGDRDAIAFVALDTIPEGEVIHFTDSAWDGSTVDGTNHFTAGEGNVSWTSPVGGVTAGTVVVIDAYDTVPAASVGTATGGTGLSSSSETIYAYQGAAVRQPTTFLAAVSNATLDSIVGTGLTAGSTALTLLPSGTDSSEYTGPRFGQAAIADYLPIIANVAANWTGGGEGDFGGTVPNATAFTSGAAGAIVDISSASISEGNSGSSTLGLTVTRSNNASAFTVDYAVTGGTATSGSDFDALLPGTLNFAVGGPLTQTINLTVNGDTLIESSETVIVTLSNLVQTSSTTTLNNVTGTATITNDDTVPVTYPASGSLTSTLKGSIPLAGSEIPAFDPLSKRAFASSNAGVQVVDLTNPAAPAFISNIAPASLGVPGLTSNDVSSITVRKGVGGNPSVLAAAIINSPKTANGHVVFLDAATGALLGSAIVGSVPDHIAFTPDGTKLLVCNEGELDGSAAVISTETVKGTVSIVDVSAGVASPVVTTADFTSYDAPATIASLSASGVRIFAGGKPSTDFEPEYLAISPDGTKAMVTIQEANAVAVLDIATATFTSVVPLGEKDFSTGRHDFSDRDGAGSPGTNLVNPTLGNPVFGLYMPDAIASYQVGGQTYYVTANEGDDRNDFLNPDETTTVSTAGYNLDDTTFPNEATLKTPASLGRLTVSNSTGLRGDTDGDTDIDKILTLGGRSFSILDATGTRVFDSGDMIEMIVASQFPALFDDGRSDNKGPEPEGVTVAKIGARTFAFVGLERSHLTLAFDVTNPLAPTFATAFQRSGDLNPEGMVVIQAADSPSGKPLLLVSNEVSNTLTIFELNQATNYTLQVLHYYGESGLLGIQTAPIMGAMIDRFDNQYANTLVLAEGDTFIPGPWLVAGADPSLNPVSGIGSTALGRPDIAIMNAFGTDASALGNHEFDLGSPVLSGAVIGSGAWVGAQFPFITANLDFAADSSLRGIADSTLNNNFNANNFRGQEVSAIKAKIAPYAVSTISGQKIGIVGATTWDLLTKTSPNGTVPKDDANPLTGDIEEVAAYLQGAINALGALGVNKVILVDQLDTLQRNKDIAGLVTGIDIMVAGGGHERMGDANDTAVPFNGHDADFIADAYPIVTSDGAGNPTLIVTTDTEFSYLGRLVADFDSDGVLILPNLNTTLNGAYASSEATLQAAYGTADPASTIIAGSTIGSQVKAITDAINVIVIAKDSTVFGFTDVYLEGDRVFGRTQEVNLGDITADANAWKARAALGLGANAAVFSLKNGGGIRASLGSVLADGTKIAPLANDITGKPAGGISQLDIENALRFDNKMMVFDTTPAGLEAILEFASGLSSGPTVQNGGYPQVGNIRFSYDSTQPVGSKLRSAALVNEAGVIVAEIVENGAVLAGAPVSIPCVALNFTANGGDGYPIKANADNFRFLLTDGTLSAPLSEALDFTAAANVPANALGEQKAFQDFLVDRHPSLATAYDVADTAVAFDTRIQQLAFRADTVLNGPASFAAWLGSNGYSSTGINTDTDGDGVIDLVEYFFNQSTNDGSDLGNLPVVTTAGGDKLLTFTTNDTVAGVTATLECSEDLGQSDPWADAVLNVDYEVVSSVSSGGQTTVTLRLLGPAAAKFWRHDVIGN